MMLDRDSITLDTRNAFEVSVGKFEGALDFGMREFSQFPEKLRESGLPKDKKILIYCTGGIRCEVLSMLVHLLLKKLCDYLQPKH